MPSEISTKKKACKLAELARVSGTPPRTIRFYIARGMLPGPSQVGRNALYGMKHVERLRQISRLKKKGLTLAEIAHKLSSSTADEGLPMASPCASYTLSEDVTVLVRTDLPPWRMNRIRRMLSEFSEQLRKESDDENDQS